MSRHLMARFRHLHAADGTGLDFNWRPKRYSWQHPDEPASEYHAKLENGDWIQVDNGSGCGPGNGAWGYHLYGSPQSESGIDDSWGEYNGGTPYHYWADTHSSVD